MQVNIVVSIDDTELSCHMPTIEGYLSHMTLHHFLYYAGCNFTNSQTLFTGYPEVKSNISLMETFLLIYNLELNKILKII